MPKDRKSPRLVINLDLLKPQSNPEKLPIKLLHWLLSSGRYIFVFVEALVLIAFGARFKLDADLASKKEAIEQQIPYIESLKDYEILIRQTQLKLSAINIFYTNYTDLAEIVKKIAEQTPVGVKIVSINLNNIADNTDIKMSATAASSSDMNAFIEGLKSNPIFSAINISSVGFEKSNLTFSLTTQAKLSKEKRDI